LNAGNISANREQHLE